MTPGKWFKADEFKCNCGKCGLNTVHPELIKILDKAREHLGVPLRINSGVRCGPDHHDYNGQIGGASQSLHLPYGIPGSNDLMGFAADVTYADGSRKSALNMVRLWMTLENVGRPIGLGLGLYPTFVHVDVRSLLGGGKGPARWTDKYFPWPR
tara:strand:+ start:1551 stop:2009 length:459 start_codon:yes stop_codon:yes gene_type:complete